MMGDGMTANVTARRAANAAAAKRYRERQKVKAKAGQRVGRGYSWEPFSQGHELSTVHGAYSARKTDPLASQLIAELLDSEDCPEHCRLPRFRWSLEAWARTTAQLHLVSAWLADQVAEHGLEAALAESTSGVETMSAGKGRTRKVSAGKRIEAGLVLVDRLERRAAALRAELLLSPAAASRAGLDVVAREENLMQQALRLVLEDREDGEAG
jgi:hypothetical protein